MNHEWYSINDFDDFVNSARKLVFKFFGDTASLDINDVSLFKMTEEDLLELEETLTFSESALIVKDHAKKKNNKKNKSTSYYINDKILANIIEELNSRMISNILSKLVSKGVLESAYDSEIDDFVFWIVDENKDKPETD